MRLGLIGAGRTAAHLALALQAAGQPLVALGARQPDRAAALAQQLGLAVCEPHEVLAQSELVLLAVRDEAIAPLASALPWKTSHLAVHLSGATPLSALAPAARRAGFHPLQLFADPLPTPAAAAQRWQHARVGIEAADVDYPLLADLARRLGAVPLRLQGGQRAAYHAAANLAASALLAPLQAACEVWASALGLSTDEAWQALQPLAEGALQAARQRGLVGALSGPVARGDASVLAAHLAALPAAQVEMYRMLMRALLPLAARTGRVSSDDLARLEALLGA
jgi:predicted short-subunit dehydrogenase-like oxidoreductase (DUF2520 family)